MYETSLLMRSYNVVQYNIIRYAHVLYNVQREINSTVTGFYERWIYFPYIILFTNPISFVFPSVIPSA